MDRRRLLEDEMRPADRQALERWAGWFGVSFRHWLRVPVLQRAGEMAAVGALVERLQGDGKSLDESERAACGHLRVSVKTYRSWRERAVRYAMDRSRDGETCKMQVARGEGRREVSGETLETAGRRS